MAVHAFVKTNRALLWVLFSLIAITATFFTYHYFPKSFPIVNLTIAASRNDVLKKSLEVAQTYTLQPENPAMAASFSSNLTVQFYTELEAGGVKAFKELLDDPDFSPYTWNVRLFKENSISETTILFRPTGVLYGFSQQIPEDDPGAALAKDDALRLAQETASQVGINLTPYFLVEDAQKTNSAGRIDYTFTYEHTTKKIGVAPYRVQLKVAGDTVTEVVRLIKIPEAFLHRYQEMRSANNTLASAANQCINLLYYFLGCIGGIIFLMRRRLLIWKSPMAWALFIAVLGFFNKLNMLPLIWTNYDTSSSMTMYLINYLINSLNAAGWSFGMLFITFVAAEGLTRAAFGNHPQFWKAWFSPDNGSRKLIGRMFAAYLSVPIWMCYITITYMITNKFFGWWSPANALYDPNILATYAPWVQSIALSFQAGFMEECLFRAIPLAGAVLLGKRYGNKKWWIIGACIMQALIFGAAHANYAAQPFYARLIELFFPALLLGVVYIWYGLIPTIIAHFVYDVVWFSLPIWIADTQYIWISHLCIIILSLLPLVYGLISWLIATRPISASLNKEWQPGTSTIKTFFPYDSKKIPSGKLLALPVLAIVGILGLGSWSYFATFTSDIPQLQVTKNQANTIAQSFMSNNTIVLKKPWASFPFLSDQTLTQYGYADHASSHLQRLFVWRTHRELFTPLLHSYLSAPSWKVRFMRFAGDLEERAEKYDIMLNLNGTVAAWSHYIPQQVNKLSLSEEQAFNIAWKYVQTFFTITDDSLEKVAVIPTKLPHRTDWTFVWRDKTIALGLGQARLLVHIVGDEVSEAYRFVFVPQQWIREYMNQQAIVQPISVIGFLVCIILILVSLGVIALSLTHLPSIRFFCATFFFYTIILGINFFNKLPTIIGFFNPIIPYNHQLLNAIGWSFISILANSAGIAALITLLHAIFHNTATVRQSVAKQIITGISLATSFAGLEALCMHWFDRMNPVHPQLTMLTGTSTIITTIIQTILYYTLLLIPCMFILFVLNAVTNRGQRHPLLASCLIVLFSISISALALQTTAGSQLLFARLLVPAAIIALVIALIYWCIARFNHQFLIYSIATYMIMHTVQQGFFRGYPEAITVCIISIITVIMMTVFLTNHAKKA